jgi:pyruvate formate lyase activating enzyme
MGKECVLYSRDNSGKVICLACAHKCLISEGKTGICGVRENIHGKLMLLVYGKIAAMHVDPIEKKPLYHFLPGSFAFSIGTVRCNFKCDFCQNWDLSQISKGNLKNISGDDYSPEEIVKMAVESKCKSIAYTYNEPVIFAEFVKDCSELAHKNGLKNIMVTNGYWSKESFEFLKEEIDAVNIDLKGDSKYYKKLCGGKLKPVLETIKRCHESGIHVEITTLVVPGENDSDKVLEEIAKFIYSVDKNIVWHISRFFPQYKMVNQSSTPIETLKRAKEIGNKVGLRNIYLGNV